MTILVACEESQAVCKAFRAKGHDAYSCDIQECSGGRPEWHIRGDVLQIINGRCDFRTMDGLQHEQADRWDMIIAFPPCTKTRNAEAIPLYSAGKLNVRRYYEGIWGKALFMAIWSADCEKIVIENPTPSKILNYPPASQVIRPYYFGHPVTKRTLLWLRGVPPLKATNRVTPERTLCPSGSYTRYHSEDNKGMHTTYRAKNKSKTFAGVAEAMAAQWG